jgi:hypothetical protein
MANSFYKPLESLSNKLYYIDTNVVVVVVIVWRIENQNPEDSELYLQLFTILILSRLLTTYYVDVFTRKQN